MMKAGAKPLRPELCSFNHVASISFCWSKHSRGQTQVQGRNKHEQGEEKVPLVQPTTETKKHKEKVNQEREGLQKREF